MKYMGLDLGSKSCGVALTDPEGKFVRGLENMTFETLNYQTLAARLMTIIEAEQVDAVVIGYPISLAGEEKTESKRVKRLKKALKPFFSGPIELFDERFSTRRAHQMMIEQNLSRKNRKGRLDEMSAVVILSDYLTWKGNQHE